MASVGSGHSARCAPAPGVDAQVETPRTGVSARAASLISKFFVPEIVFGPGALREAVHAARRLGGRKVFVVTDPGLVEAGWLAELEQALHEAELRATAWHGVTPNPKDHEVAGFEFNRVAQSWAIVGVAAAVRRSNGTITEARVGLTNMGTTPVRASAVEQALAGAAYEEGAVAAAAERAAEGTDPPSDLNGQPDYRQHFARVLTRRAVLAAGPGRRRTYAAGA